MTVPVSFEVNGEEVKLTGNTVKNYLVRGNGEITDQELVMFINLCKYQKLNPFLNEAYLVKFGQQPAQIIVSKEAFMKRAEANSQFGGFEAGIVVDRNGELVEIEGAIKLSNDKLIGGWCKVYRNDRKMPIVSKISLDEFSKGQATWKQMPLNMIRKSAIVNALREAFPDALGAMYTEEETNIKGVISRNNRTESVKSEIEEKANSIEIDVQPEQKTIEVKQEVIKQQEVETVKQTEQQDKQMTFGGGPGF